MYVPNPIRCRKCLRLGHFADNCTKEPICGFCSKPEHQGSPCETFVPTCVNCKEKHHSLDPKCPRLIEEKEIKTIQFREKITYSAAKKQFKETHNTLSKNYADVVRMNRKGVEVACQTDASISSGAIPRCSQTLSSRGSLNITGLTPLPTPLLSLPNTLPPSLPSPSTLPSPLPVSPSPTPIPPSLSLPSGSTDHKPPSQPSREENVDQFKTPPLPKRSPKGRKQKKTGNKKSEDEMDAT